MDKLMPLVIVEAEKCIGCRVCEWACHLGHGTNMGKTAGALEKAVIPKLYRQKQSQEKVISCRQCEGAPCAVACVKGAIRVKGAQLTVDTTRCDNCQDCVEACPFGAIKLASGDSRTTGDKERLIGNKCDLCKNREQGPACVQECPSQAIRLVYPAVEIREKQKQAAQNSCCLYRNR